MVSDEVLQICGRRLVEVRLSYPSNSKFIEDIDHHNFQLENVRRSTDGSTRLEINRVAMMISFVTEKWREENNNERTRIRRHKYSGLKSAKYFMQVS